VCNNRIGALAQLFRQIPLADSYVPSWVPLMDIAPVGRNPVGNSDKTSGHCAASPVGDPRKDTCERIHHLDGKSVRPRVTC
jgi:hypothetical protein